MYRKLIVGFKDTPQGRDALRLGQLLARASGAEMLVATVPTKRGRDLADLTRTESADLVVLGSTHRGRVGRVLPGAMAYRLLGEGPCAVAVAPPGFSSRADGSGERPLDADAEDVGIRVIGVGYDASPAAEEALEVAAELAVRNGAALRVYAVALRRSDLPGSAGLTAPGAPSAAETLREELHRAVSRLPAQARALPIFRHGLPAVELIEAAENGIDLLALGTRRGGPVRRAFLGSVTSAVLQGAACPVLISPTGIGSGRPAPGLTQPVPQARS